MHLCIRSAQFIVNQARVEVSQPVFYIKPISASEYYLYTSSHPITILFFIISIECFILRSLYSKNGEYVMIWSVYDSDVVK